MRLIFGDMTKKVNVFNLEQQPRDMDDQAFEVNHIDNLTSEHSKEIELETECEFELESEDFNLDKIVNSAVNWASNIISLNAEPTNLTPLSIESSSSLELKALPTHLKYIYLGGQETLSVIIATHLTASKKRALRQFLENIEKPLVGWWLTLRDWV